MDRASTEPERIRIGRFEIWPARHVLMHEGRRSAIGGRALDVLMALIEHRQRIVAQDELLDRVWPGLAIEPNNLQVQIWSLRRVLGADAIATVSRRGYRYVGPEPVTLPAGVSVGDANACRCGPEVSRPGPSLRRRLRWDSR